VTQQLYFRDAYLKECESLVVGFEDRGRHLLLELDRTCLQPSHRDGGDKGVLVAEGGERIPVTKVVSDPQRGTISHRVAARAKASVHLGATLTCELDWATRYPLMRKHTGNHLLYGLAKRLTGRDFPALSKTSLGETYTRWIGQANEIDDALVGEVFRAANGAVADGGEVVIETLAREEALERCGRYHEAYLPRSAAEIRVVTIEGVDSDPCIGLHVRDLSELGELRFARIEREGADLKVYSEMAR
jgi:Ser-tRNA(Ala) deacylase AlaX